MYKSRDLSKAYITPSNFNGGNSVLGGHYCPIGSKEFETYYSQDAMMERFLSAPSIGYTVPNLYQLGREEFRSTDHPRPRVNFCEHKIKDRLELIGHGNVIVTSERYYKNSVYNWKTADHARAFTSLPASTYFPKPLPGIKDVDGAARRAWWTMQPRFQSDSNLLLSLAELKDFRDVAHSATKAIKHLSSSGLSKDLLRPKRTGQGNPVNRATETVANGILLTNFAIRPLLSDISTLIASMQTTVLNAQNAFIDMGISPHTTHYSETLQSDYQGEAPQTYWHWTNGFQQSVKFTASMERTYSMKPQNAFNSFVQYYGLGLTFETIFNLIPFSFLTDYVFTISKSIRAMENKSKNVDVLPLTYYESTCYDSTWGMYAYHLHGYALINGMRINTSTPRFVSGYRTSYYKRYPARPNYGPALPNIAKYRDRKLLNTIALLRVMF